jgi:hypothetical protein
MSETPSEVFDEVYIGYLQNIKDVNLSEDDAKAVMQNLSTFSQSRPPKPEPEPTPEPVPTTVWGKTKAGLSKVWDNETTRVLIKAGGTFAGVAVVVYSTVHRDHVLDKQAIMQANQRPS